MTVAMSLEQRRHDRAEQVEHLRRKIAAVSGKVGDGRRGPASSIDPLPDSESLLPVPESLAELSPWPAAGRYPQPAPSLPRGTVAVLSGARSLSLSMVAAVTAEGGHAAIVGQPDVGLLAAVEMGADLSRIAVIPEPGADPVEVAAVLMDGMDLVVLELGGRSIPPTRRQASASGTCSFLPSGARSGRSKGRSSTTASRSTASRPTSRSTSPGSTPGTKGATRI